MTVYFLIPVFNEEKNLASLAADIQNCLPGIKKKYIFSDDGSTDNSRSLLGQLFASQEHTILGDGKNHGPGHAFNSGFEWILKDSVSPNDRVVTLEADNTSDLGILPVMFALSQMNYNLVLASAYAQGGGFDKTSFLRKLLSALANICLRSVFDVKVQTLSSFYRVYHVTLLRSIKEKHKALISEPGFLCMIEMVLKAIRTDSKVIEVPMVVHSSKRQGKSKMKVIRTMFSYVRFLMKSI